MAKKLRIYTLLGGFAPGPDGLVDSAGMFGLDAMLAKAFPGCEVGARTWDRYGELAPLIAASPGDLHVVIGYSGGGSRATWLAHEHPHLSIDLMVLYDPSPAWQMQTLRGTAVKRCVEYHNNAPFFFGLGGGTTHGPQLIVRDIAEQHAVVQYDSLLHQNTLKEIRRLLAMP